MPDEPRRLHELNVVQQLWWTPKTVPPVAALGIVLLLGYPVRAALAVAVALAQIGEFSFMLAALGAQLKVLPGEANNSLIAVAIVSISLNPPLYRLVDPAEGWLARRPRLWRLLTARARNEVGEAAPPTAEADPRFRAVVVGYGTVGRTLCRLLRENGIEPTVIEMNVETVQRLRAEGVAAVYGDAGRPESLAAAGVAGARALVLSASGIKGPQVVVRLARELNPDLRVLARSAYLRDRAELGRAGADVVFSGEGEVALALVEEVMRELGASAEQIDRERDRVRADLFGDEGNNPRRAPAEGANAVDPGSDALEPDSQVEKGAPPPAT